MPGKNGGKAKVAPAVFAEAARKLAEVGRQFYARGWLLGTSGNLSAVLSRDPLRLVITPSGVDKGKLSAAGMLEIDGSGAAVGGGSGRASAEALLHLAVVRARGAGAVMHTHSAWSTLLSMFGAEHGGLAIEGYEMLKGLEGVSTHEHREWLPILGNSQDVPALARRLEATLERERAAHAVLLRGHGLYTWGETIAQAKRHVEIMEFLMEVVGRSQSMTAPEPLAARASCVVVNTSTARRGLYGSRSHSRGESGHRRAGGDPAVPGRNRD